MKKLHNQLDDKYKGILDKFNIVNSIFADISFYVKIINNNNQIKHYIIKIERNNKTIEFDMYCTKEIDLNMIKNHIIGNGYIPIDFVEYCEKYGYNQKAVRNEDFLKESRLSKTTSLR